MKSLLVDVKKKNATKDYIECTIMILADVKDSAIWLTKGNMKSRDEAAYCFLQDRNIFFG
jgi:hypothetical protein